MALRYSSRLFILRTARNQFALAGAGLVSLTPGALVLVNRAADVTV